MQVYPLFIVAALLPVLVVLSFTQAGADQEEELAKAAQNPVADLISVPFQNNILFGVGPEEAAVNVLNIQPVVPFGISDDWNIITRTVLPVIHQGEIVDGIGSETGLGDTTFSAFLSPARPGSVIWGVGPVALIPTSTEDRLGAGEWGAGLSAVALTVRGPVVAGALVNNVWSFDGSVNSLLLQPFVNYNFKSGWYAVSSPVITADWDASSDERWTLPVGGGFGRVFAIGRQPVNAAVQAFYNVDKPEFGPEWSLRLQLQLLFPR